MTSNGGAAGAAHSQMEDITARMRELATHRGDEKRRNKRDRAALKSTFRDLITTVEAGHLRSLQLDLQSGFHSKFAVSSGGMSAIAQRSNAPSKASSPPSR